MKDICLEEMLKKMHQNSLVEKAVINVDGFLENMVSIYKRDKAFLKTAEESATKSGDNYIVLRSFKKEILIMADTRKQKMQRLMYLKWRFNKDLEFFEDYKKFMNNLLIKVYPIIIDDSQVGRTWYIKHGVQPK